MGGSGRVALLPFSLWRMILAPEILIVDRFAANPVGKKPLVQIRLPKPVRPVIDPGVTDVLVPAEVPQLPRRQTEVRRASFSSMYSPGAGGAVFLRSTFVLDGLRTRAAT
jgi:hypothetical protein